MDQNSLTSQDLVNLIEEHYNIGTVQSIIPILDRTSCECFHIVTSTGEYLLKDVNLDFIYHPYLEPIINNCLLEADIPVSTFIKTMTNEYIIHFLGHVFHLQTFIKGKVLLLHTAPTWFLHSSASLLAKIHKALESISILPSGIGPHYFEIHTIPSSIASYQNSIRLAQYAQDYTYVKEIEYRINLLSKLQTLDLSFTSFTYKNTHGDYSIRQILCGESQINAVIDFTSCCTHPVCWELIRSYAYADPKCQSGCLDISNLIDYIEDYLQFSTLNIYDIQMMPYLFLYYLALNDCFATYYTSDSIVQKDLKYYINWSTLTLKWLEENVAYISEALADHFSLLEIPSLLFN